MPTIVDKAICVRHWDFSETSQTVSLLTRGHGTLRGLAKGAKRERGRFSGGIDLLTRGEVVGLTKPGRELATLTDWDLRQTWRAFRERLQINRAAFYVADLASRLVGPEDPHPPVFDALVASFDALQVAGVRDPAWTERRDVDETLVRFQWSALAECGYRPQLDGAPSSGVALFDPQAGGIVVADSADHGGDRPAWRVRADTIALLSTIGDGETLDAMPDATIARAARLLAAYAREILGHEPHTMTDLFGAIRTG